MIEEFHYTLSWRASSPHPGSHASHQQGGAEEFAGLVPFFAHPNPRNLDVRASLTDPFGQLAVRRFRQRSQISVWVLADLSASMGYHGKASKPERLARFAAATAWSTFRHGDRFGFVGADTRVREELFVPLRLQKGGAPGLYDTLRNFTYQGADSDGLLAAVERLGRQRALIFLVSDFHFSLESLDRLLTALSRHDVVPIVLWDSAEYAALPAWGLALLEDPETGEQRRLFMRPQLKQKFLEHYAQRRDALSQCFRQRGRSPFFMADDFNADALTRYFLGGQ